MFQFAISTLADLALANLALVDLALTDLVPPIPASANLVSARLALANSTQLF